MQIKGTDLQDCYQIIADKFGDERGYFSPYFIKENLKSVGIDFNVVQCNRSMSSKGVIRGLHFQKQPYTQAKIVEVIAGAALDIVLDLRKDSPSYMELRAFHLTANDNVSIYVPRGFAHGFLALEDNTVFQYLIDNDYKPEAEDGVLLDDPDLKIDWSELKKAYHIDEYITSEKDRKYILLKDRTIDF